MKNSKEARAWDDAFVAQIQGFDRRSNGPYLRDIAGGFRDLNEAFA